MEEHVFMQETFVGEPREQDIVLPDGRFHYVSWGAERTDLPARRPTALGSTKLPDCTMLCRPAYC